MRQTATRWRTAAFIGALTVAGLAGCGSGDGSEGTGATPSANPKSDMLAYTQCMRDNGVPLEDPQLTADGEGSLSLPEGVDKATLDAAEEACRKLMPNGGEPPELDPAVLEQLRAYSKCMREHGVDDFPDPEPKGGIQYQAPPPGTDADFTAAEKACEDLMPVGGSKETHEDGA